MKPSFFLACRIAGVALASFAVGAAALAPLAAQAQAWPSPSTPQADVVRAIGERQ